MTYRGATLNWYGRQLKTFIKNGTTIAMTYDADGLRSTKQISGVKTEYQYVGDKLFYENRGNGDSFYYFYDSYGKLSAIYHHRNGTKVAYHVVTNSQGDVIALYSWSGALVASYEYDAWGNCTITQDTSSTGIATLNPFRYRGYYYDTDLGLYYLQSRYYDATIGRFINADSTGLLAVSSGEISDKNLFSYCDNNPVCREDTTGNVWETVFDLVSLGFSIYDVVKNPQDPLAWVGLAGDAIDLIPFVCGVGEAIKAAKIAKKALETAGDIHDSGKAVELVTETVTTTKKLHRPYIRKSTREAVESAAPRLPDGRFLDANTGIPINGKYDLGHKPGHEFWRERDLAMSKGWTQKQFNDYMNNPIFYQIESPALNRSHMFEMK